MEYLIIPLMAFLGRACGGGWPAPQMRKQLRWDGLPEFLFGACFGAANFIMFGSVIAALIAWGWAWAFMEIGHTPALQWGNDPIQAQTQKRKLTPIVNFISDKFYYRRGSKWWCRVYMAVKGGLIGLPVLGLPLIVLWPLAYNVNRDRKNGNFCDGLDEMLTGAFAGVTILLSKHLIHAIFE